MILFAFLWTSLSLSLTLPRMFDTWSTQTVKHYRQEHSLGPTSSMLLSTLALLFPFAGQYLFDNVDCRLFVSLMNGRWLLSDTENSFTFFIAPLSPALEVIANPAQFIFDKTVKAKSLKKMWRHSRLPDD